MRIENSHNQKTQHPHAATIMFIRYFRNVIRSNTLLDLISVRLICEITFFGNRRYSQFTTRGRL